MKIYKILGLLLAIAMICLLVACGGEGVGSNIGNNGSDDVVTSDINAGEDTNNGINNENSGNNSDGAAGNGSNNGTGGSVGGSDSNGENVDTGNGAGSGGNGGSNGSSGTGSSGSNSGENANSNSGSNSSNGNGSDSGNNNANKDGDKGGSNNSNKDGDKGDGESGGSSGDNSVGGGGSGASNGGGDASNLSGTPADILDKLVIDIQNTGVKMPMSFPPTEVTPDISLNTMGLSEADFGKLVVSASYNMAAIGTFAHQIIVIQAKDVDAASEVKKIVSSSNGYDPKKWICVFPEQVIAVNAGEYVLIVASYREVVEAALKAFEKSAGSIGTVETIWEHSGGGAEDGLLVSGAPIPS